MYQVYGYKYRPLLSNGRYTISRKFYNIIPPCEDNEGYTSSSGRRPMFPERLNSLGDTPVTFLNCALRCATLE